MNVTFALLLSKRLRYYYVKKILEKNKVFVKEIVQDLEDNICPEPGEFIPIMTVIGRKLAYNKLAQKINDYAIKNGIWKQGILNGLLVYLLEKDLHKLSFFRWR